jgi:hypothetical protein
MSVEQSTQVEIPRTHRETHLSRRGFLAGLTLLGAGAIAAVTLGVTEAEAAQDAHTTPTAAGETTTETKNIELAQAPVPAPAPVRPGVARRTARRAARRQRRVARRAARATRRAGRRAARATRRAGRRGVVP